MREYIQATLLAIASVVSLASCATATKPAAPAATVAPTTDTWLMYQRSPDHNAVVSAPAVVSWKFDAGARVNGGLALVGTTLILDTFAPEVIALDVRSGNVLWRSKTDGRVMSTPVVSGGLVYIGSGDQGRLSGGAGTSTYASTYSSGHGADGNPVWGRPEGDAMMAFDLSSGEKRWSYRTVGEDMPSPAIVGDTLIFANGDLHTYGLNARTGEQRWVHAVDGIATMASATVAGALTYLSVCNDAPYRCQTLAVDARSGNVAWHAPYGNSDSSPAVGENRVYVSGVVNARGPKLHTGYAVVAALDAKTGRLIWRYRTPQPGPYTEVGSSERAIAGTYANGLYYQPIPTHDALVAFDAKTGAVRWHFTSAAPIKMSPVIAHNRLYVGDTAGLLYSLDAQSGALKSRRLFKKSFTTSPPVVVGQMMLVADDTVVYAIPAE
jgi:serine/threonine-protein kinase